MIDAKDRVIDGKRTPAWTGEMCIRDRNKAVEMLQILSSPEYQARNNKDAFLLHSVGHMNKGWEVDASISYADYYYLEAFVRLKRLKEKQSVLANL